MAPRKRAARPPDLAFDALVEATRAIPEMERGKINIALAAIKAAWQREGFMPEDLPDEIRRRAVAYETTMQGMLLTPTALATHWNRVVTDNKPRSVQQSLDELRREE